MKDKIKEIILSVNPGMDVEDEDFNIAEDMDSMDYRALKLTQGPNFLPNKVEKEKQKFYFVKIIKSL